MLLHVFVCPHGGQLSHNTMRMQLPFGWMHPLNGCTSPGWMHILGMNAPPMDGCTPEWMHPFPQKTDGTRPTGMHACFHAIFGEIWPKKGWRHLWGWGPRLRNS